MTEKKERTLYISDLDGTLMGADSRLSDYSVRLLNEVISRGALVSIATARTPATVSHILEKVNMTLPAIVMTGAALWDTRIEMYSDIRFLPAETTNKVIRIHEETGVPYFLYTLRDNLIHIYHSGPMSKIEAEFAQERVGNRFKVLHTDTWKAMPQYPDNAILFYTMHPGNATRRTFDLLMELGDTNTLCYHDIFGPEVWILETFAPDATKAIAIETLRKKCGATRTVVFGDNVNDMTMMECADVGVAVENAIDLVRQRASITIGPNTSDSVARWIYEDFTGQIPPEA